MLGDRPEMLRQLFDRDDGGATARPALYESSTTTAVMATMR